MTEQEQCDKVMDILMGFAPLTVRMNNRRLKYLSDEIYKDAAATDHPLLYLIGRLYDGLSLQVWPWTTQKNT